MEQRPRPPMPAPTSPRPAEPPKPAAGSPELVPAVGAPPAPLATVTETRPSTQPLDLGQAFLAWVKQGLVSGDLAINTVNAGVHRVKEGVLLVSPGIFRDYANAENARWDNGFQKLRLHRKTPDGFNIWNYSVIGERRICALKGIPIEHLEKTLGPNVRLPSPNVHVVFVPGAKA